MCLIIDPFEHRLGYQNDYEPKTTRLPKKVYKILRISKENTYYTPYLNTIVRFENEEAILEAPTMMYYYKNGWDITRVVIGIHAFYNEKAAFAKLPLLPDENYIVFEATIPSSTKYFMGIDRDIVCEKLIIKNKTI